MTNTIHPTAIISEGVTLGNHVTIGPLCYVGPKVTLDDNVELKSHVSIDGITHVGEGTTIYPFASIGHQPQDLKYHGEESELIIGKHNTIREHVTMNPGTEGDKMVTRVGDHCLFMVASHVAHDCVIGNHVILANNATLAGHVKVGDFAVIGGLSAIHQFVRVGHHAMIGGMSGVENDVIPYGSVMGDRAGLAGLNIVGMKRHDVNREDIHALRNAYRLLFSPEGTFEERIEDVVEHFSDNARVMDVIKFIRSDSSRSLTQPKNGNKIAA